MRKLTNILSINSVNYGSTGSIMLGISNIAKRNLFETFVAYPSSKSNNQKNLDNSIIISNRIERNFHLNLAYYTGMNGCYSKFGTKFFLNKISKIKPDIIHLHNLHNCYINLEMLFSYIKANNIRVVWTLHDCWSFTGQCPHYSTVECNKWKTGCYSCPQYKEYPPAKVDRTEIMYKFKRNWFTGIKNMYLVTPSDWLRNEVLQSFLKEYPVTTINNGIDLSIFKPTDSNFRQENKLEDKIILLGVANPWTDKKGLKLFYELSELLNPKYKVVMVGLSNEQIEQLPPNILGLPKTKSQSELAKIYTAADFFVNPSIAETMGLVTVEALACGTPAIVSNLTAVPEMINDKSGIVIKDYSVKGFMEAIMNTPPDHFNSSECREQAITFDINDKYKDYIELYHNISLI